MVYPTIHSLIRSHWRMAMLISGTMVTVYFGFILVIAFGRSMLSVILRPGLSLAMLLGLALIALTWTVTLVYVRWANRVLEPAVNALRGCRV